MLNINDADLIGKGAHRLCYKHPDNKSLCIKVVVRGHDCALEIEREKNITDIFKNGIFPGI